MKNIDKEFKDWKKYINRKKKESAKRIKTKAQNDLQNQAQSKGTLRKNTGGDRSPATHVTKKTMSNLDFESTI